MLRACEPMVVCSSAGGGKGVALWRCGGRGWWRHDFFLACGCLQAVSHQDVVGEGEPAQGGVDLGQAPYSEPGEAPLAEPRIDAFAPGATLVAGLDVRALPSPAPGGDARAALGAGGGRA